MSDSRAKDSDATANGFPAEMREINAMDTAPTRVIETGETAPRPAMAASHVEFEPRKLGPFIIKARIGEGGMGVVYLGHDEGLDRLAAVKVISDFTSDEELAIKRLRSEAQAAARLQHPNIVSVYAFGEDAGRTYIAFEYIEGKNLHRMVKDGGPLPVEKALDVVRQAALALRYARVQNIIHRDIKPSNLMMLPDGTVKVADFGLAKRLDRDLGLTASDMVIGSPYYMAPEQGLGKTVDFRADIYALGCTLYNLVSGVVPFDATTPLAVMMKHAQEPVPETPELKQLLDGGVLALIRRMMAKEPNQRHESYDDLIHEIDDLQKVAGGGRAARKPGKAPIMLVLAAGALVLFGLFVGKVMSGATPPAASALQNSNGLQPAVGKEPDGFRGMAPQLRETAQFLGQVRRTSEFLAAGDWECAENLVDVGLAHPNATAEERQMLGQVKNCIQRVKQFETSLQASAPDPATRNSNTQQDKLAALSVWEQQNLTPSDDERFAALLYATALGAPEPHQRWGAASQTFQAGANFGKYQQEWSLWVRLVEAGELIDGPMRGAGMAKDRPRPIRDGVRRRASQ